MARTKVKLAPGDVFAVPIAEGTYSFGQFLEYTTGALGSVGCSFFRGTFDQAALQSLDLSHIDNQVIAVLLVTPDLLERRKWLRVGNAPIAVISNARPYEQFRAARWVGAKIIGSGIIVSFLAAFHGYEPWEQMKDPEYFDKLLLPGVGRDNSARVTDALK